MQYNFSSFSGGSGAASMPPGSENVFFIFVIAILLLQLRTRRVRFIGLVVMPVLMLILTLPLVSMELFSGPLGLALIALGFIVGAGIGVVVGSMMEVKVDEKDGSMLLKGSILAVLVWAAVIGLKIYGKDLLSSTGIVDLGLLTSAFLMLTVGMMISRRVVTYWRYLQMKKTLANAPVIK